MGSGLRCLLPQIQLPPDLSVTGAEEPEGRVFHATALSPHHGGSLSGGSPRIPLTPHDPDTAGNPAYSLGDPGLRVTPVISLSLCTL